MPISDRVVHNGLSSIVQGTALHDRQESRAAKGIGNFRRDKNPAVLYSIGKFLAHLRVDFVPIFPKRVWSEQNLCRDSEATMQQPNRIDGGLHDRFNLRNSTPLRITARIFVALSSAAACENYFTHVETSSVENNLEPRDPSTSLKGPAYIPGCALEALQPCQTLSIGEAACGESASSIR